MGRVQPLNWDDLWKVFEIIREGVKPDTIVTLTLNRPGESGDFLM